MHRSGTPATRTARAANGRPPRGGRVATRRASSTAGLSNRDRELFALRASGWTLAQIGERFGITRQRVDEILRDRGGPVASEALAAREVRDAALIRQRSKEILRRWRAGVDAADIARDLGFTFSAVREVIYERASGLDRAARSQTLSSRTSRMKYSDHDLLAGIRKVAKLSGHPPSEPEYDKVARTLELASVQTIIGRAQPEQLAQAAQCRCSRGAARRRKPAA
jgi:DNA-binding CsgD family transcriptional regulator